MAWFARLGALFALLLTASLAAPDEGARDPSGGFGLVVDIDGAIGPALKDHLARAIDRAEARGATVLIVRLDTPGGLETSMRDMVKAMLASRVPVVVWVAPSGARAASAGAFLVYASHVAAMAPATNLGAATPVAIGGSTPRERPNPAPSREGADDVQPRDDAARDLAPAERKSVNDAVAFIRALAELRGRNADWAASAVSEAASLPAAQALRDGVVEIVARDLPALLEALHGRTVQMPAADLVLRTRALPLERIETDWRTEILGVITNPSVAYGLLMIGLYGLLLEGYNPGTLVPGIVGAISLVLALFALQLLPVNYAGLGLLALGLALIVAEFLTASAGVLGIGGVVALVVGSVVLFDGDVPGLRVSRPLIAMFAATIGGLMLGTAWLAVRGQRRPPMTGAEGLVDAEATVVDGFPATGRVRVHGEIWNARSPEPLAPGQHVRVTHVDGLVLDVSPLSAADTPRSTHRA